MADKTGTRNGDSRMTLARRLGTDIEPTPARGGAPTTSDDQALPLRVADEPAHSGTEPPTVSHAPDKAPHDMGSTARLQSGLVTAETRARRLAAEVEVVQSDVRRALEVAVVEAQQAARSWRRRVRLQRSLVARGAHQALTERGVLSRLRAGRAEQTNAVTAARLRTKRYLVVLILFVLAVGAGAWSAGLVWTSTLENVVLDSGFKQTAMRWRPAGLRTDVSRMPGLGRGGSVALQVRTHGAADGEGPGYFEAARIRSGKPHTFSIFARALDSAAVYPEIRWRAIDGSLLGASRGSLTVLDQSWRRLVVSGVAPVSTASALLVVGEKAGTSAPVTYLLDDAQLERAATPGSYVETGEQTGVRHSHPTDVAALLVLIVSGLLAFVSLRGAVLVALPLSLAIPPSFANLESHLPDITPTRALVIACLVAAVARGQLRAPSRWLVALGLLYSVVVLVALVSDPSFVAMRLAASLTIGAFAPALLVLAVARERRDIWILATSLAATAGIVAVGALAESYFDHHWIPLFPGVIFEALERSGHLRARATFPHPIVLGTFLAMGLQLTLSLLLAARGLRKVMVGAAAVVIACGLAVTLSRAPWLGAVTGIVVFAALSGIWRRWRIILVVTAVLAALVASPIGAPMRDAVGGLVRPETEQERFVVQVRIELAKQIGSQGVRSLVGSSLDPSERTAFPAVIEGRPIDLGKSIDNTYVRELVQTGILGMLALIALLAAVTIQTIGAALRESGNLRTVASGLVAAQVVVLVVGLTVGTLSFSQVGAAFWLVAGAGIAIGRLGEHAADLQ